MKYEIDMKLPSLNDYIYVCRSNKYQGAKYKSKIEQEIGLYLINMPRFDNPIKIHFHWIEGNKKRDLDNICFAKKFILDSMVKHGKLKDDNNDIEDEATLFKIDYKNKELKDDNRKCVYAFTDTFEYGKETKVILEIEEF